MKKVNIFLLALFMSGTTFANSPDKTLGDHLVKAHDEALKANADTWDNKDFGYKVKIHGQELVEIFDKHVLYYTDLIFNNSPTFVMLQRDEKFNSAFREFMKQDGQHNAWLNRLSKEGGGTGTIGYKSKLAINIKAQPIGWITHQYKGKAKQDLQFKVLEICNSTYKRCTKVDDPISPSLLDRFTKLFK